MGKISTEEGNKLVAEFMGVKPTYEWCVGNKERDAYCYSPSQIDRYSLPASQKQECERWCRDNKIVCKENGYEPVMFTWYPFYNSDWNKLMEVVEKIESIEDSHHGYFGVHISSNGCTIQATNLRTDKPIPNPPHYFNDITLDTKKESTWYACIKFIQWYNNQSKK